MNIGWQSSWQRSSLRAVIYLETDTEWKSFRAVASYGA